MIVHFDSQSGNMTVSVQLIRDLDLLPQVLGQDWSSVFLQRFDGTVTYVVPSMFRGLH